MKWPWCKRSRLDKLLKINLGQIEEIEKQEKKAQRNWELFTGAQYALKSTQAKLIEYDTVKKDIEQLVHRNVSRYYQRDAIAYQLVIRISPEEIAFLSQTGMDFFAEEMGHRVAREFRNCRFMRPNPEPERTFRPFDPLDDRVQQVGL